MLGWRESFDLLLSSKSEWDPVVSVCGWHMCTHVPWTQPEDAESVGKIVVVVIIIMIP